MIKNTFFVLMLPLLTLGVAAQSKLTTKNIDHVVKMMTLEEKASLLIGYTYGKSYTGLPSSDDPNAKAIVPGAAGETGAVDRLHIPHTVLSDGPAGLRISPLRPNDKKSYYCTGFPVGTCLASSWNTELVTEVGKAIGNETLEYGADIILGPGMNIHRNPLCGRNFEYYSEDPVLTGKIAAAYVNGVQSNGVGVSIKHFAGNNQETNRMGNDAIIDQRTLREIYLKGFEIAVKEGHPWTVMSSYNKINGEYTQYSHDLLTDILRGEWGFDGIVVSDWTNTRETAAQIHAGNDLLEPGNKEQIDDIINSVKSGKLSMGDVDICVKRILQYIVKTPRYNGYRYTNAPDLKAHALITRQSATEGMVLLKNDNALPLTGKKQKIAIFGKVSYKLYAGGTGSGDVNKAYVIDLQQGLTNAGFFVNKKLEKLYSTYLDFDDEVNDITMEKYGFFKAFMPKQHLAEPTFNSDFYDNLADSSDVALITIGRSSGEGSDRKQTDFYLSDNEKAMISNVCSSFHKKTKKVVVILNIGGVIETASWKNLPDAIILAWQPGQEGGNSIADILSGKVSPSGKLPDTYPMNITDIPSTKNFPTDYNGVQSWDSKSSAGLTGSNVEKTIYEEGLNVGYRYFCTSNKAVSYPFGYGLSYTTFKYSNAKIKKEGNKYVASVIVKNVGKTNGKEVVQLYITAPQGIIEKPEIELKAFAKTRELKPGESQIVKMNFSNYDLASYDTNLQSWVTDAGLYQAKFSASALDVKQTVPFKAVKNIVKCHNSLSIK